MKNKVNIRKYLLTVIMALAVVLALAMPTVALAEQAEKPEFDTSSIVYADKTVVFDGRNHYIEPANLPHGAVVLFNTYQSQPGVYESIAKINVGSEYKESVVTIKAKLTILATEIKAGEKGSFIAEQGIHPSVQFALVENQGYDFTGDLAKGRKLYANYSVNFFKDTADFDLEAGDYKMSVKLPVGYSEVKILVKTANGVKEAPYTTDGKYAYFEVDESVKDFAITYGKEVMLFGEEKEDWTIWVQIILGVVVAGEALTIVLQALKLKKM